MNKQPKRIRGERFTLHPPMDPVCFVPMPDDLPVADPLPAMPPPWPGAVEVWPLHPPAAAPADPQG